MPVCAAQPVRNPGSTDGRIIVRSGGAQNVYPKTRAYVQTVVARLRFGFPGTRENVRAPGARHRPYIAVNGRATPRVIIILLRTRRTAAIISRTEIEFSRVGHAGSQMPAAGLYAGARVNKSARPLRAKRAPPRRIEYSRTAPFSPYKYYNSGYKGDVRIFFFFARCVRKYNIIYAPRRARVRGIYAYTRVEYYAHAIQISLVPASRFAADRPTDDIISPSCLLATSSPETSAHKPFFLILALYTPPPPRFSLPFRLYRPSLSLFVTAI